MGVRVAVDTGGTFTDFVRSGSSGRRVLKVPSTPDDPSRAIGEGLRALLGDPLPPGLELIHGTTVATNALLERKGARVALVANEGFEDLIEIGRQARPEIYALAPRPVPPLVPRGLRFGVAERTLASGAVLRSPSGEDLAALRERIRAAGAEAVAVGLLHSYRNAASERRVKEALAPLGIPVTCSCEILPEFREFERFSTATVNAFLLPVMGGYLRRLEASVGAAVRLSVMQSNGGLATAARAREEPVQTLLSGPAGGAVGALAAGRRAGFERVIGFDMGGTSTDVSLALGGLRITTRGRLAGLPVKVPMLDIHTVGAGGGSIAWRDGGGALRVGPRSAGAVPGPACYGRSSLPTVTDANLVLGRLDPRFFLGGAMPLHPAAARDALTALGAALGLDPLEAAQGVVEVVEAGMEKAIRVISVERGFDPREFALVSFGGAGGLHAFALASKLGIPAVVCPVDPGCLSAEGMLGADPTRYYARSLLAEDPPRAALDAEFAALAREARRDLAGDGLAESAVRLDRIVEARYRGQSHEVAFADEEDWRAAFERAHERLNGYAAPGRPVEVTAVRLRASAPAGGRPAPPEPEGGEDPGEASQGEALAFFGRARERGQVYDRARLRPGMLCRGPAIVGEYSSTTLVPEGAVARVDGHRNLVVRPA